jgi:hypothetical protein
MDQISIDSRLLQDCFVISVRGDTPFFHNYDPISHFESFELMGDDDDC